MENVITRKQVLEMLCVSESTLRRLIRDGELPQGVRHGRLCRRWRRSDIESFLARREAETYDPR